MGGKIVTQEVDNTVRSALSGRMPICLTTEQTVRDAAAVLSENGIGAAPVLAGERLVGIFSERDILRRVVAAGRDAGAMRVAEAMTHDPRTVSTTTSLVEALALMIEGNFRHLPVVDGDGRVIAMLSMRDIPFINQLMHLNWTTWTNGKVGTAARA
jgi:CBS domain-containing protein